MFTPRRSLVLLLAVYLALVTLSHSAYGQRCPFNFGAQFSLQMQMQQQMMQARPMFPAGNLFPMPRQFPLNQGRMFQPNFGMQNKLMMQQHNFNAHAWVPHRQNTTQFHTHQFTTTRMVPIRPQTLTGGRGFPINMQPAWMKQTHLHTRMFPVHSSNLHWQKVNFKGKFFMPRLVGGPAVRFPKQLPQRPMQQPLKPLNKARPMPFNQPPVRNIPRVNFAMKGQMTCGRCHGCRQPGMPALARGGPPMMPRLAALPARRPIGPLVALPPLLPVVRVALPQPMPGVGGEQPNRMARVARKPAPQLAGKVVGAPEKKKDIADAPELPMVARPGMFEPSPVLDGRLASGPRIGKPGESALEPLPLPPLTGHVTFGAEAAQPLPAIVDEDTAVVSGSLRPEEVLAAPPLPSGERPEGFLSLLDLEAAFLAPELRPLTEEVAEPPALPPYPARSAS